jgi:serine/threonine-protein kinase RsbW
MQKQAPMPASHEEWTWRYDQVVPSNTASGRRLLDDVVQQLELLHWSRRDIFGVYLAVEEALANAICHGNGRDETKHIQFSCRLSPRKVRIEVTDEGSGFDPAHVPDPTAPDRLGCPGGRGVLLMRAFMSRVEFCDGGSHVVLEKDREA